MKIRIGQVFRVSRSNRKSTEPTDSNNYVAYTDLTRGTCFLGADIYKGIWGYKEVSEPGQSFRRRPAIILHSNSFKADSLDTPWFDVIEPDNGYAIYNGDNRRSELDPYKARGNALLMSTSRLYRDPNLRVFAPPILLFAQQAVNGNRTGYRKFSGYGIPIRFTLQSQREKRSDRYFTNLVVELVLFNLDEEQEEFDWAWIDRRRDGGLAATDILASAPRAWREWVKYGEMAIERCRRKIARNMVTRVSEQLDYPKEDKALIKAIVEHFSSDRHAFEGLASLVAKLVIGERCTRGWITKRSGDGGIDFVCRLDLGSDFSSSSIVVLGQAKCKPIDSSVSGRDLARVVARLQRGWIGVFVTTGVFSKAAQEELRQDRYPVLLINGKRLARELRIFMNREGVILTELLARERHWYETNTEPLDPARITDTIGFGIPCVEKNSHSMVD